MIESILYNPEVRSTMHSSDTHGVTEASAAVMGLLGNDFSPRIKGIGKQTLYSMNSITEDEHFLIRPKFKIKKDKILSSWDQILRLIASLKWKRSNTGIIFKRLNSYSKKYDVYMALKELGRLYLTQFTLKYYGDLEYRQSIEKQLNIGENSNRFSKVLSFGNNQELDGESIEEIEIIEGCKRLIKNSIVCWNYLYFSQLLLQTEDEDQRVKLLESIKGGSMVKWAHINFHGEYDFTKNSSRGKLKLNLKEIKHLEIVRILSKNSI
jgi:TnpA family transposase